MIILQKAEDYRQIVSTQSMLIVEYGSNNGGICGAIQERIEYWRSRHCRCQFLYVQMEQFQQFCSKMNVYTVPTVIVYVNGIPTIRESGIFNVNEILDKANRYYNMIF